MKRKTIFLIGITSLVFFVTLQTLNTYKGEKLLRIEEELITIKNEADLVIVSFVQNNNVLHYYGEDADKLLDQIEPIIPFKESTIKNVDEPYLTVSFYKNHKHIDSLEVYKFENVIWVDNKQLSFSLNNYNCLIKFHNLYWTNKNKNIIIQ